MTRALPGKRCFLTGGAGFIGSHLVRRLVDEGHEVHVLVRPTTDLRRLVDCRDRITVWCGDCGNAVQLGAILETCAPQVVFHLAASTRLRLGTTDFSDVQASITAGLVTTMALIQAAARLRTPPEILVRTGTIAEYGDTPCPALESQREQPVSCYAAAAVAATHYCQMLQPRLPFATVTLRLALVYGAAQASDFFIPSVIDACLANRPFTIAGADRRRDLIHVEDVVEALCRTVETPGLAGQVINIATGTAPTMHEVAHLVRRLVRGRNRLISARDGSTVGDVSLVCGDPRTAARLLGWRYRIGLEDGLSQTVSAHREQEQAKEAS